MGQKKKSREPADIPHPRDQSRHLFNEMDETPRRPGEDYQRTVDFPDEWHHIMLDNEELVTVRWEQVEGIRVTEESC